MNYRTAYAELTAQVISLEAKNAELLSALKDCADLITFSLDVGDLVATSNQDHREMVAVELAAHAAITNSTTD